MTTQDAIVIGGGPVGLTMAMLLAARDFEVTVVDRDPSPPDTAEEAWESWDRRSVGQFRQVHYLQPRGRLLLEEHLPSVLDTLRRLGAVRSNVVADHAQLLPGGPAVDGFEPFDTLTTCRRPVLELAFVKAALATPGVEVRRGVTVNGLETAPSALHGVPHVVGVRTTTGTLRADVVIDAGGRRSPVPCLLGEIGAMEPKEEVEELGFVYHSQFYRGDRPPEVRGDVLAAAGSISVLTMPGDNGHWAVTLYHSPCDKQMRRVRDPRVFERVLRSLPLHANWADGERVGDVESTAGTVNTRRHFVVDGAPVVTGLVPVGDAWGFTNPSLGRGIALGLLHAVDLAPVVVDNIDDPSTMARRWEQVTNEHAALWHDATVQYDRVRGPEVEALRLGLPDPHDPNDLMVAGFRAFDSARHYDAQVLRWWGETVSCLSLPGEVMARPGVFERVLAVAAETEPYRTPAPSRAELENLLVATGGRAVATV